VVEIRGIAEAVFKKSSLFSDLQSLESKYYSVWEIQKRQMEKSLEGVGAMVLSSYFLIYIFSKNI
jgi:hypothetical protein